MCRTRMYWWLKRSSARQRPRSVLRGRGCIRPWLSINPSIVEAQSAALSTTNTARLGSTFIASATAAWEPDLWGNIHRGITAAASTAQATYGDLENARLLFQSELAQDYFQLHGIDREMDLLQRTVASYTEYLTLTRNRFAGGVASDLDVAQAESQLDGAQSSLIELGV